VKKFSLLRTRRWAVFGVILALLLAASGCARTPSAQGARFMARGESRMAQKDYARAALEFRNALRLVPDNAESAYQLALAYLYSGDYQSGIAQLHQVLRLDPRNAGAHLKLAELRAGAGSADLGADDVEVAERRLREILDVSPNEQSDVTQTSIENLERGFARNPANPEIQSHLVRAYILQRRFPDAERTVEKILAYNQARRQRKARIGFFKKLIADFFSSAPPPSDVADQTAEKAAPCAESMPQNDACPEQDPKIPEAQEDAPPLVLRAQVYLATVRAKEAEQDLIQAVTRNPRVALAHYLFSKVHQVHGGEHARRHELLQAVSLAPNWLRARLELAHALTEGDEAADAIELLEQAPRTEQTDVAFITEFNWALLALDDRIGLQRSLERVASQDNPDLLIQEGILRLRIRDGVGARRFFQLALQIKPQDIRAADALAETYFRGNKPDLALSAVREYASRYPKSGGLQYLLGTWLMRLNYSAEARTAFDAAIQASPGFLAAMEKRADLDIASGNPNAALQAIASVAAAPGGEGSAELALGVLEEHPGGNSETAIAHYRKALQFDPDNLVALNNLAFHLAATAGHADEAVTLALRAKKLDPNSASVDDTLGWAYYNNGAYKLAVQYLQESVARELKPDRKYRLAMAYFKAGESDKAHAALRDALKMNPSSPEAASATQLINGG